LTNSAVRETIVLQLNSGVGVPLHLLRTNKPDPRRKMLDDNFKPITLDELIVKVRKSMNNTRKQRKDFIAQGDKSMKDYADGWIHALTFVLANADEKWWSETEKLNK
jgi:hypothetical protein